MWIKIIEHGLSNDYESKSKWFASLFIVIGSLLSIYVLFSPLSTSAILGASLTTIGVIAAYLTAKLNPKTPVSWSKSLLIFFTGMLFLFVGLSTLSSMGLLVGLFFLFGTLNNLFLAYETRQNSTAVAWLLHAAVSGYFAIDILLDAEHVSAESIGLYVAINLFCDGAALFYSGRKIYIRP